MGWVKGYYGRAIFALSLSHTIILNSRYLIFIGTAKHRWVLKGIEMSTQVAQPDLGTSEETPPLFVDAGEIVALGAAVAAQLDDLTLSRRLAHEVSVYGKGRVSKELRAEILARAGALAQARPVRRFSGDEPIVKALVKACVGGSIEDHEHMMLLDQSQLLEEAPQQVDRRTDTGRNIAIIGAGVSGIAVGRELLKAGYRVTLYERSDKCAGTWSQNRYPGCGVDSPSYVYAYSFAQKPDWSRYFVRREEIDDYIENCATEFGLRPFIRLQTAVVSCRYDAQRATWDVQVKDQEGNTRSETFDAVVSAVGQLNTPSIPNIKGLNEFGGTTVHTAEWRESIQVQGKRVAVVGVGASSMQVAPTIAPQVSELYVFQRQPHWVMPNNHYLSDVPQPEIECLRAAPAYLAWKRLLFNWTYGDAAHPALTRHPDWPVAVKDAINPFSAKLRDIMRNHIRNELRSRPELIPKMTPDYPPYSKRVLLDNNWYKMFLRNNVRLVTEGIRRVTKDGIETEDGQTHKLDVIVLATGYQASRMLHTFDVFNGRGVSLKDMWGEDDPRAYLGVTVPGFPNFFLMYGPNTNLAFGGSAIIHSEFQATYIRLCLDLMAERESREMECTEEAFTSYNRKLDERLNNMVWAEKSSTNWFRNAKGRVVTNSPWSMGEYWSLLRSVDTASFHFRKGY